MTYSSFSVNNSIETFNDTLKQAEALRGSSKASINVLYISYPELLVLKSIDNPESELKNFLESEPE